MSKEAILPSFQVLFPKIYLGAPSITMNDLSEMSLCMRSFETGNSRIRSRAWLLSRLQVIRHWECLGCSDVVLQRSGGKYGAM